MDSDLLKRFVSERDEEAFAAIVARHGPMVLGVCRLILDDHHDAEDAFQATFLVLARKAGSIRKPSVLGSWLHGVARRIAVRAREDASRRHAKESQVSSVVAVEGGDDAVRRERRMILHQELDRLPEKYRDPIVLCYLESLSHEEAASQLGWPVGTVKGRLARARDVLRTKLARLEPRDPDGLCATMLPADLASVSAPLMHETVEAASRSASGETSPSLTRPASWARLVEDPHLD